MQSLIVGLPLPSASFDNHSFLAAPSFGEYQQLVVDLASVSRAVDDIVHGTAAHTTYGGQAVVNGEASPHAFPLREILTMRRRETEWMLSHGGLIVVVASPGVPHADIAGDPWNSFDWLPEPDGFSFADDLLAGFGRPGAVLVDSEHPFAPIIQALAPRLAYRVYVNEEARAVAETGHVFARSEGGVPIAFDMRAGEGHLVFLPTILKPESDRPIIAQAMLDSFERWNSRNSPPAPEPSKSDSVAGAFQPRLHDARPGTTPPEEVTQ
ncbi:MAG: hypothetical protein ABI559_06030 [Chloroflexota bacterium]